MWPLTARGRKNEPSNSDGSACDADFDPIVGRIMAHIIQYPAHVYYSLTVGPQAISGRELCYGGLTVRGATEAALSILQAYGITEVEISTIDGMRFFTRIPGGGN